GARRSALLARWRLTRPAVSGGTRSPTNYGRGARRGDKAAVERVRLGPVPVLAHPHAASEAAANPGRECAQLGHALPPVGRPPGRTRRPRTRGVRARALGAVPPPGVPQ